MPNNDANYIDFGLLRKLKQKKRPQWSV